MELQKENARLRALLAGMQAKVGAPVSGIAPDLDSKVIPPHSWNSSKCARCGYSVVVPQPAGGEHVEVVKTIVLDGQKSSRSRTAEPPVQPSQSHTGGTWEVKKEAREFVELDAELKVTLPAIHDTTPHHTTPHRYQPPVQRSPEPNAG